MFNRFPLQYPEQPLVIRVESTKGLASSDKRVLTKLLNSLSAEHARNKAVAGFSIADSCQEFLLTKNTPDAARNDRTVTATVQHAGDSDVHCCQRVILNNPKLRSLAGRWFVVAYNA